MSSYRPKSLDELNSRYDQALSADLAIKKGVSGIRENENLLKEKRTVPDYDSFTTEAEDLSKKVASAKNVEDISGAVDDFIRHLNSEYSAQSLSANRPQPNRVVNPQPKVHTAPKPLPQPEPVSEDRSELLDNYMKVMTDQYDDDDDESEPSAVGSYLKKKSRKRRREKVAEPVETAPPVKPAPESQPMPLPQVDYNDADYMSKSSEIPAQPQSTEENPDNAPEESFESLESTFNRLDKQAEKAPKKKKDKTRVAFRAVFSILLSAVLILTAVVASLVLVLKVNTGNLSLDKYYFVTTTADFEEAGLSKGDLVVCQTENSVEDGSFVLCVDRNAGSFFFGKKTGGVVDDEGNIMYLIDGQNIYQENVLGSVQKSIGHIGGAIDFIFNYYILILGALLVLAIILILVVAVALRNKGKNADDDEDEDDEPNENDNNRGEQAEESEEESEPSEPAEETADSEIQEEPEPEETSDPEEETGPDSLTGQQEESTSLPERKSRKKNRKKKNKKNKNRSPKQSPTVENDEENISEEVEESYDSDYNAFSDI